MRKMSYSVVIFLTLLLDIYLYPQTSSWEDIGNNIPGDSLNDLSDVFLLNRWVGWISSMTEPEIYRSEFSNGTWEILRTPSPVTAFYMLDYSYGFACGTDSTVYKTTDDGDSWNYFGSAGNPINDIDFTYGNPIFGYICGEDGVIGTITDTGLVVKHSGTNQNFSSISSPEMDKVWLIGDSSIYFYNGNNFIKQFTAPFPLHSIYFMYQTTGYAAGDSGFIALTTDGGNIWTQQNNFDTLRRNLNDIYLLGKYGWAVGEEGLILVTTDGGYNWGIDTDWITPNKLKSIHIGGSSVEFGPALAVGENKSALMYPIVVSVDDEPIIADDYKLSQNYPNPFNPNTKIRFTIPPLPTGQAGSPLNPSPYQGEGFREWFITLKVYDVLGNEIATLVNEEKPAGNYEVEFDGSKLPSGIYYYQLVSSTYSATKKMVLLK